MKKIYCLTEYGNDSLLMGREMFMTLDGVAKWLTDKKPIGNKMTVADRELEGVYDITAENLEKLVTEFKKQNMGAAFSVDCDFFIQTITLKFTLSEIDVRE